MSPLKKNRIGSGQSSSLASLIFIIFLLLSSLLLMFFVFFDNRSFDVIVREIDEKQQRGIATLELYRSAMTKAENERDYLRLIKRIYRINQPDLRNQISTMVTAEGVQDLPGNEVIWAYHASALLDSGMLAQAIAASINLQSREYLTLKGEILIRSLAAAQNEEQAEQLELEGFSIFDILKTSSYSAATYVRLARLFRQPRFAWNAALLYMLNGERDKALLLIRELQEQPWLNTLAAALIAYDNQDWPLATSLLEQELNSNSLEAPDVKTIHYLGDAYAYQENYQKVIDVLGQIITPELMPTDLLTEDITEKFSPLIQMENWHLYYNLASAYHELGENNRAFEVLNLGVEIFPKASEILLLLNMVAPPDEKEYAKNLLLSSFANNPDDPDLIFASLLFEEERIDHRKFGSQLWKLFSSLPGYERLLHYLLWYYIGLERTADVDLALERYQNLVLAPNGRDYPNWAKEYMAINAMLNRDFSQGENLFNELLRQEPTNWRLYYNMANIYVYQVNLPEALGLLRKALEFADDTNDKIQIYYRIQAIAPILRETTQLVALSEGETAELDDILRSYVRDNYAIRDEQPDSNDEILYAKIHSLLLWRKIGEDRLIEDNLLTNGSADSGKSLEVVGPDNLGINQF